MNINIIMSTARCVTLEIQDGGHYHTKRSYTIFVNDILYRTTDTVITNIFGLKPSSDYCICIVHEQDEIWSKCLKTKPESVTLNVMDFGARGDGKEDDTTYLQAAISSCPKEGRVLVPTGIFQVSSLFLKSDISIELEKGAVLLGRVSKTDYPVLPGLIENYEETKEYYLGTWEGNPLAMHAGLITAIDVKNIYIYGEGILDGNADICGWWKDAKKRVKIHRPRLVYLCRCQNIQVLGLTFQNSPSWTIHPYFCKRIGFYANELYNPWNSPNTDGINPESSQNIVIAGVHFSLGDDCIAIKSGKIYMGSKYKTPSQKIVIQNCLMENGHGAVTIGSEMAAGVEDVTVRRCIFRNTDRGLRIKTRRGRGKDAVIDNINFRNVKMEDVKTPLVINSFYFCDPDGHTNYVQSREILPIDERTPKIKRISFSNITCQNCHIAAAYVEGLPEQKIECLELKNIRVSYAENSLSGVAAMTEGVKETRKQGFFIHNVKQLLVKNVTINGQDGNEFLLKEVDNYDQQ